MMLRRSRIGKMRGVKRVYADNPTGSGPKYYYPTDKLEELWLKLNLEGIRSVLRTLL